MTRKLEFGAVGKIQRLPLPPEPLPAQLGGGLALERGEVARELARDDGNGPWVQERAGELAYQRPEISCERAVVLARQEARKRWGPSKARSV